MFKTVCLGRVGETGGWWGWWWMYECTSVCSANSYWHKWNPVDSCSRRDSKIFVGFSLTGGEQEVLRGTVLFFPRSLMVIYKDLKMDLTRQEHPFPDGSPNICETQFNTTFYRRNGSWYCTAWGLSINNHLKTSIMSSTASLTLMQSASRKHTS